MGSFLSTGFVQGGFLFWSRLREVGAVGKWPARATAKSLAAAGHLSTAVGGVSARQDLIAGCRGRTEGSPAVGATIAPQPCIRWSRRGLLAMKQSYASGARLRGAGPFCRRHKGHSSGRVTATSDRHRQLVTGSSANWFLCTSCRRADQAGRSGRGPQLEAGGKHARRDPAPQRDEQLAGPRPHHCPSAHPLRPPPPPAPLAPPPASP